MVPVGRDYPEIRDGVRAICAKYPDKYWRDLEDNDEYADAFVAELSAAGYLGALIPEQYGGAGLPIRAGCVILEEIHAVGLQRRALPGADVHDGHAAAARQRGAEAALPAGHRERRHPLPGVWRHRADDRLRHHPAQDPRRARRPALRRQRPEGVDVARAQVRPDAAPGAHHAGRSGQAALRGACRCCWSRCAMRSARG